jgi:hypothetical protein
MEALGLTSSYACSYKELISELIHFEIGPIELSVNHSGL